MAIRRRGTQGRGPQGIVLPSALDESTGQLEQTDEYGGELHVDGFAPDAPSPRPPRIVRRPLAEILVEQGAISAAAVEVALEQQSRSDPGTRLRIGELLIAQGLVSEITILHALAAQFGIPIVSPMRAAPDTSLVGRIPREMADGLDVLVMRQLDDGSIQVAVSDPTIPNLVEDLSAVVGDVVSLAISPASELSRARDDSYQAAEGLGDIIRAFDARATPTADDASTSQTVDENAPIVQVVSRIIETAVNARASDVHIEPMENRVRVRTRIDGALKEVLSLPLNMAPALSSRIKIMAGLNIVERRRPQDGQIELHLGSRGLDIRVSTTGTMFGESVVLRILDRQRALYGLSELGMPEDVERRFRDVIQSPYGLVVCAGPTGSGKTTTLYTTLTMVKSDEINVMTVEDPVEYVFPDINQISINEAAGLTFASGLRAILRQDPDTILVGEIRDVETARIAVQAALTGHFVLSTVHATDSASALHRFIDMGIEPFLLASSLIASVGQRLVRKNCENCVEPYQPPPEELAFYDRAGGQKADDDVFRRGRGCEACAGTGYFGRVGVYEVLRMTDSVRDRILAQAQADEIRRLAVDDGMIPMQEQAVHLIDEGVSTVAEVMRTVYIV